MKKELNEKREDKSFCNVDDQNDDSQEQEEQGD